MHNIKSYPCHVALWLPIQRESGVVLLPHGFGASSFSVTPIQRPVSRSLSTNQSPVSRSRNHSRPMRVECLDDVITLDQWEASVQVKWSLPTNERPMFRSHDHSRPMRGQCPDYVITLPIRGQDPALRSLTTKWETRFKLLFLAYIYKEGERIKMG